MKDIISYLCRHVFKMKLFALILSLYIIFLTTLPCADGLMENRCHSREHVSGQGDSHQHCDRCSPFCTCDCCASHVVPIENTVHFEYSALPEPFIFFYSSDYHLSTYSSIWHPPKIG
jgi:hypothetical protein